MASINGNWFHSRSSSNLSELLTVRALVRESQKLEYVGFGWAGGRQNNPLMYQFARSVNIEPSTMQTKIRAMIRYGFIKNGRTLPLVWTKMGNLWNELYSIGNFHAAEKLYELTLCISLAIYAFNNTQQQYSHNPRNGVMPLKFLFNSLDNQNAISLTAFSVLIDGNTTRVGRNDSYWKSDLINSGLFSEINGNLFYSGHYPELVSVIRNFIPSSLLSDDDWDNIRDNPLISISPFSNAIQMIFESIGQANGENEGLYLEITNFPIIEALSEEEELSIPDIDILSTDTRYANSNRRVRNSTWSKRIKRRYNYLCAVPNCDVDGEYFVEASHIKPDSIEETENEIPHRSHILNGLCLCKHCHVAFDKGYFTLSDDHRILVSPRMTDIADQNLKQAILSSANNSIKNRTDNRMPLPEFIQYHRIHKFLE